MTAPIVALQMEPLPQISVETNTTFALGLEAQNRGFQLFVYTADALSYREGKIVARGHWVIFKNTPQDFYTQGKEACLDLSQTRFVLMRQDPPFNMAYITATHLLELLPPSTKVVNNPAAVRNAPEKLLVTYFKDLMPPTLISWDKALVDAFIETHGSVVLKPLFDFGGNGVLLLNPGDPNLTGILEMYRKIYETPLIFQKFLPEVALGDKRIILIDGKPVGILNRVPPIDQIRSNLRLGGSPEACDFSARDLEICARIGPTLKERGLYLVGIDVIGDYITEINVTSPTGLPVINRLYNVDLAKDFWDGFIG